MASVAELRITEKIAEEIGCVPAQVVAAAGLLDEGATVPFIARYRKEVTGGLDDTQLRALEERLTYLRELEERRATILASIEEQGKLTAELAAQVDAAETKQALEDLYLPYKPKRRTKAQIAREAGLEPLAEALLADPSLTPEDEAEKYLNADAGFAEVKAVLDGARQILMERFSEDAALLGRLREYLAEHGVVRSTVVEGKESEGVKFRDYFDYSEPLGAVPSHRALALLRGRNEGALQVALALDSELDEANKPADHNPCEARVAKHFGIAGQGRPADKWLADTVRWTWRIKLFPHLEGDLMNALRERAEDEAIRVFGANLHDLLLAAPAGPRATMGIDPGIRTGCKVAVVDATGKLLDTATIYPHEPRRDWDGALHTLAALARKHRVDLVSIGNGTASRETDRLVADLVKRAPELRLTRIVVSEAGASVYSASEYAAREFPELDVSLRGAVSIARRLQDPLAELVKIDPKSIGVGQYQHDVSQTRLARALDAVVEDCVNAVGVDVNTASAPLLTRVSGLNGALAANLVSYRDTHGAFRNRKALLEVPRLGEKTFEQAAGFLRINDGDNPLDASAVHPEAYPLVERILADIKKGIKEVIGDARLVRSLQPARYTDEKFGLPTVRDILGELEKPGRDPRPEFKTAVFREGVEDMKDLRPGMILEGVVTNVANFGAFVDIGVHQDGLAHISALSEKYVKDPREVVKAGDVVKVKVLEVDLPRQRIALTMRLADDTASAATKNGAAPLSAKARQRQTR
ncbi:MAG: RNA-binding transcriptional accessory protein, partial [Candidatus Accumulibacter sp.]|nr:RNA-binding transcriptional accessory protein [Accumulibacter sp.]